MPRSFQPFSDDSRSFRKISEDVRRFSKTAEDFQGLPKMSEEKSENFRLYFVVIFTCERYIFYSEKIRFFSVREILVIHSNLYNNRILFIIKIGYNAQQKWQINVIPSLSKAHGNVAIPDRPDVPTNQGENERGWHDQICWPLCQMGSDGTTLVPSTPKVSKNKPNWLQGWHYGKGLIYLGQISTSRTSLLQGQS